MTTTNSAFQQPYRVFLDETGGLMGLEKSNTFYICTAIIVPHGKENKIIEGIQNVCQKYINGAVLKSSTVGNRHSLRLKCLQELCALPFSFIALVTDKRLLDSGTGLRYKKSRYKFIHKKLNKILSSVLHKIDLTVDDHGTKEFQEGCVRYFEKGNEPDLFSGFTVRYAKDESEPILQLADFIGGSLLQSFDPERQSDCSNKFRELLRHREAGIEFFPVGRIEPTKAPLQQDAPDHSVLRCVLNNNAYNFLASNESSSDERIKMQVCVLERLYGASKYEESEHRYIYSDQLIKELKENGFEVNKRSFTGEIIGGLRRTGIIISGSTSGYKLALSLEDINEYLEHDRSIILPMLDKLARAQNSVMAGTQYDILQGIEFAALSRLVTSLKDQTLDDYGRGPEPDVETIKMIDD